MAKEQIPNTQSNSIGLSVISALGGYLLGSSKNKSTVINPPDVINLTSVSFPDIWKALFVDANLSLEEAGALYGYAYFYRPLADLLRGIQLSSDSMSKEQARRIIKEFFDRYQCRLFGLKTGLNIQGLHSITDISTGQSITKVCLIDHYQSSSSSGFLTAADFGNVLLDEATIRCPKRNSLRQFYLTERIKSHVRYDFDLLKATGSFNFNNQDNFFLRKLGAFMASNYGRQGVLNDNRGAAVLEQFKTVDIFTSNDASGCYIYLQRTSSNAKYSVFINKLTNIIYG